jgi:hypothetical protein
VPVRQCGKDYWLAPIHVEPDDNDGIPELEEKPEDVMIGLERPES